jgi:hypothetical protein
MSKPIGLGRSDFRELIDKQLLFVDKSLFVKEVIDDESSVILITRPRRWGKTLNLSMLYYFFSKEAYGKPTQGLFDNLLIAKEPGNYVEKHQGQYPVIFLSLKDVKQPDFESALEKLRSLIQSVYEEHKDPLYTKNDALTHDKKDLFSRHLSKKNSVTELGESLVWLSKLLYQHHQKKVYILIDEYDTPLNFARNQDYFESMTLFMKNFLGATLKDNPYLEKGIMTGILRISKDSMLSDLNNLKVYTVLEDARYAPYFGFIDSELDELFSEQGLVKDEPAVKSWYNGYHINGLTLYNPWSIMNCLDSKAKLGSYWLDTGSDDLLRELLQNASVEVKQLMQSLVVGEHVRLTVNKTMRFDQVRDDRTMLWNLLISAGYLTVLSAIPNGNDLMCETSIPNQEILGLYKSLFLRWLNKHDPLATQQFIELLAQGKVEDFERRIQSFLKLAASVHDYARKPEAFYHGFMLALAISLVDKYYVLSNRESGYGRPDLVMIPKDTTQSLAVILEFKTVTGSQTLEARAKEALAQIQAQEYGAVLSQYTYITSALHVGMAFDGQQVCCVAGGVILS